MERRLRRPALRRCCALIRLGGRRILLSGVLYTMHQASIATLAAATVVAAAAGAQFQLSLVIKAGGVLCCQGGPRLPAGL
mmetsp:Transcript_44456/g.117685  ORF Transcript_44456/g.117685 Transcript_44456/m.117685 type:complete len:80 (+) Transcript_44456:834-1073(+)